MTLFFIRHFKGIGLFMKFHNLEFLPKLHDRKTYVDSRGILEKVEFSFLIDLEIIKKGSGMVAFFFNVSLRTKPLIYAMKRLN